MKDFKLSNKKTWVVFDDGTTSMEIGNVTLRSVGKTVKQEVDVSHLSDEEAMDLLNNVRTRKVIKKGDKLLISRKLATTKHP